jgi:signal transduction histidine kinase/CheY-like chemotaxis protein
VKSLLVISPLPDTADAIRAALDPELYRIIHRTSQEEAEPILTGLLVHAAMLDLGTDIIQGMWTVERLRRRLARVPILICVDGRQSEWEEESFARGVSHVLSKPLRPRTLVALLERLLAFPVSAPQPQPARIETQFITQTPAAAPASTAQPHAVLRNFSSILTHSLNTDALVRQFLIQLREVVSINRAAVFLRADAGGKTGATASRELHPASAIGISQALLDQFHLSLDSGIGQQVSRLGRIIRSASDEARSDLETQREFELLGGQVAVPFFDRDSLLGVAVFDSRITGEAISNQELELIFHLLEQVGLAVRNIRLHDQISANSEMMAGVLRELNSACVVVDRDLQILHANKLARKYFGQTTGRKDGLDFADLPQLLAAKTLQVLRNGSAISPFKYEPEGSPGTAYSVTIVPFQQGNNASPASALLVVDDQTQSEQLRRLEIEASNLRMVKMMADRLAHEVGNTMVPISTHQQLLGEKYRDAEFRASLDTALSEGVKRVNRLINQMRFLARDSVASTESIPLAALVEESYQEARKYHPGKSGQIKYEHAGKPIQINADKSSIKHALMEIFLNALQSNPSDPKVVVRADVSMNGNGSNALHIEIQDNGAGFTPESTRRAFEPFYTVKNVGLGLGLTVTRKIVETHNGKLEIVNPTDGKSGVIRISLPADKVR